MWGYLIGLCMMVNGEQECQDQTFVPGFTSEIACEVHSVLQTSIINYDLVHLDGVYDIWVAPTQCIDVPVRPSTDFFKKLH
jgi:hypothetical protein